MLQHAPKHHLKILNATIGHISNLEKATAYIIYIYNQNLLLNVTRKMEMQLDIYTQREDEHLQVLTAILTDLTTDIGKNVYYLAYSQEDSVPTHLLLLEIITELREAASSKKVCIFHFK